MLEGSSHCHWRVTLNWSSHWKWRVRQINWSCHWYWRVRQMGVVIGIGDLESLYTSRVFKIASVCVENFQYFQNF